MNPETRPLQRLQATKETPPESHAKTPAPCLRWLAALALLLAVAVAGNNAAAQVIAPVSATASSEYEPRNAPLNLIDGSGLLGGGNVLTNTHDAYFGGYTMWLSASNTVADAWVAFDLGTPCSLVAADIWQYNQGTALVGRGVSNFNIYVSSTADIADATNFVGNFSLNVAGGTNGEPVQRLTFSASDARLVKFAILGNWSGSESGYVGLSEVRFEGSGAPAIVTPPQDATKYVRSAQLFSVTVAGSEPLRYQWYKTGPDTPIAGATNKTYTINPVTNSSAGGYFVVVTNSLGGATSAVATLAVLDAPLAPVIRPISVTVSSFYSADQNPINLINSSGLWGAGDVLSQTHSNHNSALWMWHTLSRPVAEAWVVFDLGAQCSLSCADVWQLNQSGSATKLGRGVRNFSIYTSPTADVADATNYVGNFFLDKASGTLNEAAQRLPFTASGVRLVKFAINSNWNGDVTGYVGLSEVRFEGSTPPVIVTQPQDAANYVLGGQIFSVAAVGSEPFSYQWYKTGPDTAIPGATNRTHIIDSVTTDSAGGYFVIVTNTFGGATSVVATLTVSDPAPDYITDLVGHYSFDETSGTAALDSSPSANNATLSNFPVDGSQWVPGRIGNALEFNASDAVNNNRVETDGSPNLVNGDYFTFTFWAKPRVNPAVGANPRFVTPLITTEHWVLWQAGNGVGFFVPAPSPQPATNVWKMFAVTFDRTTGTYQTYVDGRWTATATGYSRTSPAWLRWAIGCKENPASTSDTWRGCLDDVRIYNRVLLPGDIKALFDSAPPILSIAAGQGTVTISWPVGAIGYELQSRNGFSGAWDVVGGVANNSVTLAPTNSAQFFRLYRNQ